MKRLVMFLSALAIIVVANAIVVQKAILKNGSILYGYMQQQDGTGKLMFHTDSAEICIDSKYAKIIEKNANSSHLCDIVFQIDSIVTDPNTMSFEDYLRSSQRKAQNVYLLEKGVRVKYLEKNSNTYVVTWKDIICVQSPIRLCTELSGINRICKMKDGKIYEGQYVEETEDLQKLYMADGLVQSFKIDDVVKYTYHAINANQDVFSQSELLDIIKTNTMGEMKGIIIEQSYEGKTDAENYFKIQTESKGVSIIKISDIVELRKEENPKYDPKYDIILKVGEVMINRQIASYVSVVEKGDYLQLDSLGNMKVAMGNDGQAKLIVEYRITDGAKNEAFQLVKVSKRNVKKSDIYGFTYKDLVNTTILPSGIETSVNHTTKAEYTVNDLGLYALYDNRGKKAIPIMIVGQTD